MDYFFGLAFLTFCQGLSFTGYIFISIDFHALRGTSYCNLKFIDTEFCFDHQMKYLVIQD